MRRQVLRHGKEAKRNGPQICTHPKWTGIKNKALIVEELQWIPTVYVGQSSAETYPTCFWRMPKPQSGPIHSFFRDAKVQTDVSMTVEGHVWVKVTLLSSYAIPPTTVKEHAHEIRLYSPRNYTLASNTGQGVKTDVSMELPRGVYGHVTGHPDLLLAGIVRLESAIIKPCSQNNVQLFVYNTSDGDYEIQKGDLLASVLLLQNFVPILDIQQYSGRKCVMT